LIEISFSNQNRKSFTSIMNSWPTKRRENFHINNRNIDC